jgi:hypothetical protein
MKTAIFINHSLVFLKRNYVEESRLTHPYKIVELTSERIGLLPTHFKKRLLREKEQSATIYGVFIDNQLAHFSCVKENPCRISEINRYFSPPAGSIYIYNCFTINEFRGKGLFTIMLGYLGQQYQMQVQYISVLSHNHLSYKVIKKSLFMEIGHIHYLKFLFLEKVNIPENIHELMMKQKVGS